VQRVSTLTALSGDDIAQLAVVLKHTFTAFRELFDDPAPYMMWWNQEPRTTSDWPTAWLNMEIVSPWRANKLPRYIAGVEVATGEYFNPVDPSDIAARLRAALPL
jgi:galactose-1-phosphate uridylyltransferase